MEFTKLGNSGIEISRFCLGCMSFGDPASKMHAWTLNSEDSEKIIKHALDLGINFFDTANGYSAGTSEEYLGRAIKNNVERDQRRASFQDSHKPRNRGYAQKTGDGLSRFIYHPPLRLRNADRGNHGSASRSHSIRQSACAGCFGHVRLSVLQYATVRTR